MHSSPSRNKYYFLKIFSGIIRPIVVLASIIFFLSLIYGGIDWVVSYRNTLELERARSLITYSLVGLMFVFGLWAVVAVMATYYHIDLLKVETIDYLNDIRKLSNFLYKFSKDNIDSIEYLFLLQASLALIPTFKLNSYAKAFSVILAGIMLILSQASFTVRANGKLKYIGRIIFIIFTIAISLVMRGVIQNSYF